MSTELLRAISELIGALIWPLIIIVVLFFYRDSVKNILANLEEISLPGGFAAKIRKEARRAANQVVNKEEQAEGPTAVEIEAAEKIGIAALDYDLEVVRMQLRQFAAEYERIRSIMPGGPERTRRIQAVVAKLRTLAVAARPLLAELSASRSVGERLAAVVMLQVRPEIDWISWLGEIGSQDMTFVGHQASVALLSASRIFDNSESQLQVKQAITKIKDTLKKERRKHHRERVLDQIERELQRQDSEQKTA